MWVPPTSTRSAFVSGPALCRHAGVSCPVCCHLFWQQTVSQGSFILADLAFYLPAASLTLTTRSRGFTATHCLNYSDYFKELTLACGSLYCQIFFSVFALLAVYFPLLMNVACDSCISIRLQPQQSAILFVLLSDPCRKRRMKKPTKTTIKNVRKKTIWQQNAWYTF